MSINNTILSLCMVFLFFPIGCGTTRTPATMPISDPSTKKVTSREQAYLSCLEDAKKDPSDPFKVVDLTRRYAEQEGASEFLKAVPEQLDSKNLCDYDLIVAMETEHEQAIIRQSPECADKVVVWHINDPYQLPYKQASKDFDRIKSKVVHLAKSL